MLADLMLSIITGACDHVRWPVAIHPSLYHLLVYSAALLVLLPVGVVIYRLTLHPLTRVPGPRLAAMSNIWYAWQVREGRLLTMTKALHRRYGPAVRIGPNEVWFDSQEAFRAIYGVSFF